MMPLTETTSVGFSLSPLNILLFGHLAVIDLHVMLYCSFYPIN